jgi:hypothetical protein
MEYLATPPPVSLAVYPDSLRLTLPLGDDPMFDANFCTRVRIGPARDITRCKDPRHAGLR